MDGSAGLKLLGAFRRHAAWAFDLTLAAQASGREEKALESEDLLMKHSPRPSICSRGWLLTLKKQE